MHGTAVVIAIKKARVHSAHGTIERYSPCTLRNDHSIHESRELKQTRPPGVSMLTCCTRLCARYSLIYPLMITYRIEKVNTRVRNIDYLA